MQLPIDLKALLDEMTDINKARSTELSVSVYIDEQAQPDLAAHVRTVFASTLPTVRLTVSYLDDSFAPHAGDDLAVIVAGPSRGIGAAAAALRASSIPAMVVTASPTAVAELASQRGFSVPEADLVSPPAEGDEGEPLTLSEESTLKLDERMGRWVVAVSPDKRLAMAVAFPFMRRSLAKEAVQATSMQNAGISLVPIIPGADLPILTLNQAKMVLQIAAAYGQDMDKSRAKELAAVVGGAYLFRVVARELVELVPVLGFLIKPGVAYGGTAAVGNAAIEYFEGGQDVAGVHNVVSRATEVGTKFVKDVREKGPAAFPNAADKLKDAAEYIPVVQDKVKEYAPKVAKVVGNAVGTVVAASKGAR